MRTFKFFQKIFILLGLILMVLIKYSNGSPFSSFNQFHVKDETENFFRMISNVEFSMEDIAAMYRNITGEARTYHCSGICRTPIALWVTQSYAPCLSIKKVDCPKGLICCIFDKKYDGIALGRSKETEPSSDASETDINVLPLENQVDPVTFVQDPIPGDSEESLTANPNIV